MNNTNPYQSPQTQVSFQQDNTALLEQVAAGQKLVIYSILANFLGAALRAPFPALYWLLAVAALVMAIWGLVKLGRGMEASMLGKVFAFICLFIPLVNLLVLISINFRASRLLREAGYEVGLLGVK
ncbi:MAG TPA: hypothetical protein VFW42_00610 [Fluviicoccus sp.]|nr:hypothetical protein [Fluviicoccus sp.]